MLLPTKRLVVALNSRLAICLVVVVLQSSTAPIVKAATLTWTGAAGNGNIFTASNWTPSQAPVSGDTLIFSGTNSLTNTLGGTAFSIATLTFDSTAGAFVLNGTNTLTLTNKTGISTSSTAVETINSNLALGVAQSWTSNAGGNLVVNGTVALGTRTLTLSGAGQTTINGSISGTGGLTKSATGLGIIQLNGNNTYTGATLLSSGTVQIGSNTAFGTGTVSFGSTSLKLEAVNGPRSVTNAITVTKNVIFQGDNDLSFNGDTSLTSSRTFTTNGNGTVTFNGFISQASGSRVLTKSGVGVLALNAANTYTGGTVLSAGTLQLGNNAGAGTGTLTLNSATLQTGNSAITLANAVTLGGNTIFAGTNNITFNGNATLTGNRTQTNNSTGTITYKGAISGAFNLSKTGTGTTAYTGTAANTYTGLTYVLDGSLLLGKTAGTNAVAGALRIGDGVGSAASASVQLNSSNQIIDTSALTIYTDGQLRLQANSDTVGAVTLYGGSITGTGTLGLGGTLTFSGTSGAQASIDSGLDLNASRTFAINDNGVSDVDLTVSGVIANGSATSTISKTGAGTLALTGSNTFSGGLNVNAGTVLAGANTALGTATANLGDTTGSNAASLLFNPTTGLIVANAITARTGGSGLLTLGGLNTSGVNTFSGAITLGRSITVTAEAGGEVDFNGLISGVGGLTKIGGGIIKLNLANTFSGAVFISDGTLSLGATNALGGGAVTISGGGTLDVGASHNVTISSLTLTDGNIDGSGTSTLTTAGIISVAQGEIAVALAGSGSLSKTTSGTVVVSGNNIFTGTTSIDGGTFTAGAVNTFSANSAMTVASGATVDLQGFNNVVASLAGAGNVLLGSATLTAGANNSSTSFTGYLSGLGGLTKVGSGVFTLGSVNTYTGATTINGGTLRYGVNDAINSASTLTVSSGATLDLISYNGTFGSIAGGGNISRTTGSLSFGDDNTSTAFSGAISGTGTITKTGTGTTTISGGNTTSGAVILANGKTTLSGTAGAFASAASITIRTGATLDLDNSAVENNNRLGDSTGLILNGGTVRLLSDGNGSIETVGALTVAAGASSVQIQHNGGATDVTRLIFSSLGTIAGGASVNFLGTGGLLGDAYGSQILISGQPLGLLGSWATVGGNAAEYSTDGIRAYSDYYEGLIGVNYNATDKLIRLSGNSSLSQYTLTNSGQTTDLGLNLTDISTVDLGSARILNLLSGSLIKTTSTATTISGAGVLTAGGTSAATLGISITSGSSLTISSVIADNSGGIVGLSKADAGSLTLSAMNTFSGNVFLNGGITNVSNEANLGANGNDVSFNGGTLHVTAGFTSSAGKIFSVVASQTGTLDIDASQTLTLANTAGILQSGNASSKLIKTGAGTFILQNASTGFTGNLQIDQGRAELRSAQALGGTITLNGGTLALVANSSTSFGNNLSFLADSTVLVDRLSGSGSVIHSLGNVTLGAKTWTVSGANSAALSVGAVSLTGAGIINPTTADLTVGAVTGSFALTKTGAAALTLSAVSSYTGATAVNAGTLRLGITNALPVGTALTVATGATFDLADFSAATSSLAGSGSVLLGTGTLNTGTTTSTFGGIISGTGGLTKSGAGNLTLSNVQTYTGATTVTAGTLTLAGTNRLQTGTALTVSSGATVALAVSSNTTVASLSGAGTVSLGGSFLTTGASTSSFSGILSGTGGLTKTGAGTLTLSGNSTYSGATTISGGIVLARSAAALGSASGGITLASGSELQLENNIALAAKALSTSGTLRNNSGTNTYSGNLTLTGNAALASDSGILNVTGNIALAGNNLGASGVGSTVLSGVLSGAGTLASTGNLQISGNNSFTGLTTISAGTLQISSNNALGATGSTNGTVVSSGATLLINESSGGLNVAAETLTVSGTGVGGNGVLRNQAGDSIWNGGIILAANSTIQVDAGSLEIAGSITQTGGTRALTKTGSGALLLGGSSTFTGGLTISAGTVQIDTSDRLLSTGAVSISSGATFDLNDNDQTIGALTGSGIVQTGPTDTASGGGTLTFGAGNATATFAGSIQGKGDIEKIGSGTETLAAATSFTGATTIGGGILETSANNALGSTSSITVSTGGTLLLSGSATDRINNSAALTLDGGTLARSTGNEGTGASRAINGTLTGSSTVGLGALTLTNNSFIDFGTGTVGTLDFSSLAANGFTLNILNYTPTSTGAYLDGQSDRLIFNSNQASNLTQFNFGSGLSAIQVSLGSGFYEVTVTAVPEPSTWLGALTVAGLTFGEFMRRRKSKK